MKLFDPRAAALLLALVGGLSLSACNTIRGAGQDIQSGGEAMEDAADEVSGN
jgi:predicted small secreted protein